MDIIADVADRLGSWEIASELPTKYLPGVEYRDLAEPLPFRKVVGASVIILATVLGSGELILWPYITTQVGIGVLWLAILGFGMQFFLNMEIERYTLATGETTVTGFSRFWKPWGKYLSLSRGNFPRSHRTIPTRLSLKARGAAHLWRAVCS